MFLGTFEKLQKVSSCLSVCTLELDCHWTDFRGIIFRKSVEEIQIPFKSDDQNGYFGWRL